MYQQNIRTHTLLIKWKIYYNLPHNSISETNYICSMYKYGSFYICCAHTHIQIHRITKNLFDKIALFSFRSVLCWLTIKPTTKLNKYDILSLLSISVCVPRSPCHCHKLSYVHNTPIITLCVSVLLRIRSAENCEINLFKSFSEFYGKLYNGNGFWVYMQCIGERRQSMLDAEPIENFFF